MIQAILWDVDGTLLDFKKSEEYGIRACMKEIGFDDVDEEMLTRYEKLTEATGKRWSVARSRSRRC